jgi:hypothetical protein
MKKYITVAIIIGIITICTGCKGNKIDNDIYQNTRDVFLEEIYPN